MSFPVPQTRLLFQVREFVRLGLVSQLTQVGSTVEVVLSFYLLSFLLCLKTLYTYQQVTSMSVWTYCLELGLQLSGIH